MPVEKPDETPEKSFNTLLEGFLEYIVEVPKGLSALPLTKYFKQMIAGLWLPGILLLYFGFQEIWDVLWGKYLVEPLWSKFEGGWGSFFLVLILLSGVLLKSKPWNILQKGYGLGPQLAGLMWSVLIVLLHNRFSGSWHFFSMPFGEVICYFDLLWASLGMLLVLDAGIFCMRKPLENADEGFLHGLPINPEEDKDELEYKPLAASIARMLNRSFRPDSAFAMGVTGRYGDGKTSFINLMRQHLEAHEVIDFCPWLYSDKQALIQGYFYELRQALSRYDAALSNELEDYAQILASGKLPYFSGLARQVQTALQLRRRKPSFEVINHKLRELGIKLVVIIDDLDRLTPDEVIEVIRIIRSSGAFANTVFIAAYDKNHIAKALEVKLSEERGEVFLEKVFQFEQPLPFMSQNKIASFLVNSFNEYLILDDVIEIESVARSLNLKNYILNLRDVVRFINQFKLTYKQFNGVPKSEYYKNETNQLEINLQDLFMIELFRYKHSVFYQLIFTNLEEHFYLEHGIWKMHDDIKNKLVSNEILGNGNQHETENRLQILYSVYRVLSRDNHTHDINDMFASKKDNSKRLLSERILKIYLKFSLSPSDATYSEFVPVLFKSINEIDNYFNNNVIKQPQLTSILSNPDELLKQGIKAHTIFIAFVLHYRPLYLDAQGHETIAWELIELTKKLFDNRNQEAVKVFCEKLWSDTTKLDSTEDLIKILFFFSESISMQQYARMPDVFEYLKLRRNELIEKILDKQSNFNLYCDQIYRRCCLLPDNNLDSMALEQLNKFLTEKGDAVGFLKFVIQYIDTGEYSLREYYISYEYTNKLFGSYDKFSAFIEKSNLDENQRGEWREFERKHQSYARINDKQPIGIKTTPFNFEYISLDKL